MITSNALPPTYVSPLASRQNVAPSSSSLRKNNRRQQTEDEPISEEEAKDGMHPAPDFHNVPVIPASTPLFVSPTLKQLFQQSAEREE